MNQRQLIRRLIPTLALTGLGVLLLCDGCRRETQNPRSDHQDAIAWMILAAGVFLVGAGIGSACGRVWAAVLVGLALPIVVWPLSVVLVWVWVIFGHFDQRVAVRSGYEQIPAARQIDEFIGEADHFISGYKNTGTELEWCTDVYFGGRYELGMRVDVEVDNRTSQVTFVGEPTFYLNEVKTVEILPDGRASVSYRAAGYHEFGAAEWEQVARAQGDFSAIGISLNKSRPVPNFDKYVGRLPHRRFGP